MFPIATKLATPLGISLTALVTILLRNLMTVFFVVFLLFIVSTTEFSWLSFFSCWSTMVWVYCCSDAGWVVNDIVFVSKFL